MSTPTRRRPICGPLSRRHLLAVRTEPPPSHTPEEEEKMCFFCCEPVTVRTFACPNHPDEPLHQTCVFRFMSRHREQSEEVQRCPQCLAPASRAALLPGTATEALPLLREFARSELFKIVAETRIRNPEINNIPSGWKHSTGPRAYVRQTHALFFTPECRLDVSEIKKLLLGWDQDAVPVLQMIFDKYPHTFVKDWYIIPQLLNALDHLEDRLRDMAVNLVHEALLYDDLRGVLAKNAALFFALREGVAEFRMPVSVRCCLNIVGTLVKQFPKFERYAKNDARFVSALEKRRDDRGTGDHMERNRALAEYILSFQRES